MSVDHLPDQPDAYVWEVPPMRAALHARDVTGLYGLLQRLGYSQQRIAAMTGQSQPEVSAILHGRRVMAYDVLSRIADGLGIPRGYMGLAYTAGAAGAKLSTAVNRDTNATAAVSPARTVAPRPIERAARGGVLAAMQPDG